MKHKKISIILITLGIGLIIVALSLAGYNIVTDYMAGKNSNDILEDMEKALTETKPLEEPEYLKNPNIDMPTIDVKGREIIGIIDIPSISIKLPVINEYTKANLNIAPVLYKGTIYQKNAIIIAHNSNSHFKKITKLNLGDKVTFTDVQGNVFEYEVIEKEQVSENDPLLVEEGEWDLSLFTCTPKNIQFRTVVRLSLVE